MITFKQLLEQVRDFSVLNLEPHTKGMKKYSHGPQHVGYVDKEMNSGVSHKKLQSAAKNVGYTYYKKDDAKIDGKDMTYHLYAKSGGPFVDHHMIITTPKGSDKVWNIEHKSVKDKS